MYSRNACHTRMARFLRRGKYGASSPKQHLGGEHIECGKGPSWSSTAAPRWRRTERDNQGMITCRPMDVEPPSTLELCCVALSASASKIGRPSSPMYSKNPQQLAADHTGFRHLELAACSISSTSAWSDTPGLPIGQPPHAQTILRTSPITLVIQA